MARFVREIAEPNVRLCLTKSEGADENRIEAYARHPQQTETWIQADVIIPPIFCGDLLPGETGAIDLFESLDQGTVRTHLKWTKQRMSLDTPSSYAGWDSPTIHISPSLLGGGIVQSTFEPKLIYDVKESPLEQDAADGSGSDDSSDDDDGPHNDDNSDSESQGINKSTKKVRLQAKTKVQGPDQAVSSNENKPRTWTKKRKTPFGTGKREEQTNIDSSEAHRNPTNALTLAQSIRFKKKKDHRFLAKIILRIVMKRTNITVRQVSEIGLLARTCDREFCNMLWMILTKPELESMYSEPHYIRCLAETLLFSDAPKSQLHIKNVLNKFIHSFLELQNQFSKHEDQLIFLFHSLGILLDSIIIRNIKVELDKGQMEYMTTFLLNSELCQSPRNNPLFEKVYQGFVRLFHKADSFSIEYQNYSFLNDSRNRLHQLENEVMAEYDKIKVSFRRCEGRELWYDDYIFFKSLILSHRLDDAYFFTDSIFSKEKSSELVWFVLEDVIRIAQLPIKACSKGGLTWAEKLISDDFIDAQPIQYGHHAIYQLRKLAQIEVHTNSVFNILQLKKEGLRKSKFLALVEQELGKHLERLNASVAYANEPHLPTDIFAQAHEEFFRLSSSRDSLANADSYKMNDDETDEIYVELKAKRDLNDEKLHDADEIVDQFLKGPPNTLVILGKSGAGKSTFASKQHERLSKNASLQRTVHPMIISLPSVHNPAKLLDYVQKTMKSDYSKMLESNLGVFILDGYDELNEAGSFKIIEKNIELLLRHHVIITYRYNLQETKHDLEQKFGVKADRKGDMRKPVEYLVLQPFGDEQIKKYIQTFVESQPKITLTHQEIASKVFSSPSLKEAAESPFILSLIMKVLPSYLEEKRNEPVATLSRFEIYDRFIGLWHSSKEKGAKDPIVSNKKNFDEFSSDFAQKLIAKKTTVATVKKTKDIHQSCPEWGFFFDDTYELMELRKGTLIRRFQTSEKEEQYAFIHRSIQEFFGAKKAIQEIDSTTWEKKGSVFPNLQEKDFLVKQFLADYTFKNIKFAKALKDIIHKSASSERNVLFANAASVAITILNYARIPIHNMNFQKVKIPRADLSQAVIQNVDFSDADLSSVIFKDADIRGCVFDGSILKETDFGQLPKLIHQKPVNCGCADADDMSVQFYTASGNKISVWDLEACDSNIHLTHGSMAISALSISKTNTDTYLIVGDKGGIIFIWDAVSCEKKFELAKEEVGGGQINSIFASSEIQEYFGLQDSNDIFFAYASMDGRLTFGLFDPSKAPTEKNGIRIVYKEKMGGALNSIEFFYKDGKVFIIYGGSLPHIEYREVTFNRASSSFTLGKPLTLASDDRQVKTIHAIKYQKRYKIAVAVDKEIRIFDTSTLESSAIVLKDWHEKAVRCVQWVPADNGEPEYLISSGADRMVYLWSVSEATVVRPFLGHTKEIPELDVFKYMNEYYLLGCCQDNSAWIWSITSRELIKKASGHRKAINTLSSIMPSKLNPHEDKPLATPSTGQVPDTLTKILSTSGVIVTGSSDRFMKVWDFSTGNCMVTRFMDDLVPKIITRRVENTMGVYYQLNADQSSVKFINMFDSDCKETKLVCFEGEKIHHFDIFTLGRTEYMILATKESLRAYPLNPSKFVIDEDENGVKLIQGPVNSFNIKVCSNSIGTILVTIEKECVLCRFLQHVEFSGLSVDEDLLAKIEPSSGLSTPVTPVFTKVNPDNKKQSILVCDETGLVYRFDVCLEKDKEPVQELLFEGDYPVYSCDTFVIRGEEYVAFGDREGFLRIAKVRGGAYDMLFKRQVHNQVRAVKYDTETNTLITTGENGFIYMWTPTKKEGSEDITLLVVWTSHTTLRGDDISCEGLKHCSQPNRILLQQLKKPPIIEPTQ